MSQVWMTWTLQGVTMMTKFSSNACATIAALGLSLTLAAAPAMAAGERNGGAGARAGGSGFQGGGGGGFQGRSYQGADGIGIRNGVVIRGGEGGMRNGGGFGGGMRDGGGFARGGRYGGGGGFDGGARDGVGFTRGGRYDGDGYGYARRGYGNGYGYGYGAGALGLGLLGGAIIGQSYNNYDYDSSYDAGYDVVPQNGGDSRGYCEATFKSYNAATGTYLGYDGLRHRCP